MKCIKFLSLLLPVSAMLLSCNSHSHQAMIEVTNATDWTRTGEMAEVPCGLLPSSPFVITDSLGHEVPYQITSDSLVIFPVAVMPHSTARYAVEPGAPAAVTPRAYGRHVPEHKDNMNWENDRTAYVAYGPALQQAGERGYGYDVWTKSVDTLVIDQRNADELRGISMHEDHGNGMDAYIVSSTLGGGTAALLADDGDIIYPWAWRQSEVLDNGPLRFRVRLTYWPAAIGSDTAVVETREITLDAGNPLNRTVVRYDGLTQPRPVAAGIVVHQQNPDAYTLDPDMGVVTYADLTDNPDAGNGVIYVGTISPAAQSLAYEPIRNEALHALGHALAIGLYEPGNEYTYYWGAEWSKHHDAPASQEQWREQLLRRRALIDNPLEIKVTK